MKIVVSCNIAPTVFTHIRPNYNWTLPAAIYLATCCRLRHTAVAFTLEQFIDLTLNNLLHYAREIPWPIFNTR